uniref:Uncharacterized protein n=1 Tax=Cryptomonas curvata TaxID=233186 RepID=A0A7S0M9B7_9CRYP|mmetsp:Transcript_26671/g.55353  ORF Transcript_26671/g.55353 Transcript_26671/m.55353 type:complete len:192 (+) Transcript_26671:2-577(+)
MNPTAEVASQRSHPHPLDVSIAMCMGLHSRLGARSELHSLDSDMMKEVTEIYRKWFLSRPWSARESALCESMWLRGRDVSDLSTEFRREETDIRIMLDIYDTTIPESKLREFEREVSEGFILCDVENYGGIVQRSRTSIMPGNYGMPGSAEEIGHFADMPGRIRRRLVNRRALHDPDNVLGYGRLALTAMP